MTTATTQKKKYNPYKMALGAIYRGYLESDKAEKYVITNLRVREWKGILNNFKKRQYIVDFKLGDTIETACDLGIIGFNFDNIKDEDLVKYCNGVVDHMKKELEESLQEKAEQVTSTEE